MDFIYNTVIKKIKKNPLHKLYLEYVIYNKCVMRILNIANKVRWRRINLIVILWPPAAEFFDEITMELECSVKIQKKRNFQIKDGVFHDFVRELYIIDNAGPDKISKKLERLSERPHKLLVLNIEIQRPNLLVQDALNTVRCENVGNIKDNIRKKFKAKIDRYVYDIIIHSTEVDYQNKKVMSLIEKYKS